MAILKMEKAKNFKTIVQAISRVVDEADVTMTKTGPWLKQMDPAHVCIVEVWLKPKMFQEYKLNGVNQVNIDFERLNKLLRKTVKNAQNLELTFKENDSNPVMEVGTVTQYGLWSYTINLNEIDDDKEEQKTPTLEYIGECKYQNPKEIKDLIDFASNITDHVNLLMNDQGFSVLGKGDIGEFNALVPKSNFEEYKVEGNAMSMYSLEYLKDIFKVADISNTVNIKLGNKLPITLLFEGDGFTVQMMLAPRIESD